MESVLATSKMRTSSNNKEGKGFRQELQGTYFSIKGMAALGTRIVASAAESLILHVHYCRFTILVADDKPTGEQMWE